MKRFTLLMLSVLMFSWSIASEDLDNPIVLCQDVLVSLDEYGFANIAPEDVDDGSFDHGSGIESMTLSQTEFSCENIWEATTVTLTVLDYAGNSSECQASVTIIDDLPPVEVYCQNIEVEITT